MSKSQQYFQYYHHEPLGAATFPTDGPVDDRNRTETGRPIITETNVPDPARVLLPDRVIKMSLGALLAMLL